MTTVLIEPLDVLILRGNKLFADAGSHGEALMPPWPSVAAGWCTTTRRNCCGLAAFNSLPTPTLALLRQR